MIKFFRACRFAAAVVLSFPLVATAQATEAPAAAVAPATRVTGTFAAPVPSTTLPTGAAAVAPLPASKPSNSVASGLPLDRLVDTYTAASELDEAGLCLAKAVYFEARGESLEGQLAVAKVVLNRAGSGVYPATVCEVVTQKSQFSFIRRGRFPTPDTGSESWRKAVAIARIAQDGLASSVPGNVLWYHADYVSPPWGKWHTQVTRIGTHIFYS
jgi:spore germination cell wall hydrolase CwlJ-like protein